VPASQVDPDGPASSEKLITLVVLLSIFGVLVIVVLALCCARRSAIGKPEAAPADPLQPWTVGLSSYTGADPVSQFSVPSDFVTHDHRIDL
jgi:hypothetical protein